MPEEWRIVIAFVGVLILARVTGWLLYWMESDK